ncbi:MAG: tRNA dihydrouridine synthase DusB [Eubacteriales bacterium]|nr:tRNA dihydrouridine synthase DusB [Eubacteriales bacterium]
MSLKIGNVKLDNPFFLAPLAGITDAPTRRLCKQMGAALVYSEMVSGKGLYYNDKNSDRLLTIYEEEKPIGFQIFGSEPDVIGWTAKRLDSYNNDILDINMGCPVPKIVKNGEGSALLKNPHLIYDLISAAVSNTSKPVTAKIRIGWDANSINAVEVAKIIEAAGAAAIAVHGRTREQYYSGKADWSQIAAVKKAVSIPVIGNGDVIDGKTAIEMLNETGCDFVMVGRGALGNPWIFKELVAAWKGEPKPEPPTLAEKKRVMLIHQEDMCRLKGEYAAVREMRKHIGWYLKGVPGSAAFRGKINQIGDIHQLKQALEEI